MPRLLDPQASIDVVLQSDADKPAGQRPTFHVRVLSKRDWLEFCRRYDDSFAAAADDEDEKLTRDERREAAQRAAEVRIDKQYELARWALRGWQNMRTAEGHDLPFDATPLEDVVDRWELMELLDQALAGGRLNYEQKKT